MRRQRIVRGVWRLASNAIVIDRALDAYVMLSEIAGGELNILRRDRDLNSDSRGS
jgi:hypothetical protein